MVYLVLLLCFSGQIAVNGLSISGSDKFVFPNVCYNITCRFDKPDLHSFTLYTITADKPIFTGDIRYQNNLCVYNNGIYCNNTENCGCESDGSATHLCYNYTITRRRSEPLTIQCESNGKKDQIHRYIAGVPVITRPENNKEFNVTENTFFGPVSCIVDCKPDCSNTYWTGPELFNLISANLTISNIKRTAGGQYVCVAENTMGQSSVNITISVHYGPRDILLSQNRTKYNVIEGQSLNISCESDCRPDCVIHWIGPNGQLISSYLLSFQNIDRDEGGIYRCNATNSVGSLTSSEVNITVIYGPGNSLNFNVSETTVQSVKGAVLAPVNCSATCLPPCKYEWIKPDQTPEGQNGILAIINLTKKDHGNHTCTAVNNVTYASKSLNVIVYYGPEDVLLSPNKTKYILEEGESVNISCHSNCRPKCEFNWIGPTGQNESNFLTFNNINRNQSGAYKCNATNIVNSKLSEDVVVDVRYGPGNSIEFNPSPTTIVRVLGETLGPITCAASCNPFCQYQWTTSEKVESENASLSKLALAKEDQDEYTCKAWNEVAKNGSTLTLHVTVNYGPDGISLTPNNESYTVEEGNPLAGINCFADCRPNCTKTWAGPNGYIGTTNVLKFDSIKKNQTGVYKCNASNEVSSVISHDVAVTVIYPAQIIFMEVSNGNFTLKENDSSRLNCGISGRPTPDIQWYFNHEVKMENTTTYDLPSITCLHTGNYTCKVKNFLGEDSLTKEIFVLCSPRPFQRLPEKIAIGDENILNITVIIIAFPQPTIRWIFNAINTTNITRSIQSHEILGINVHSTTVYVNNTQNSDFGFYTLVVENSVIEPYTHRFEVQPRKKPDIPSNVSVICDNMHNSVILGWKSEFDGGDEQFFGIYYAINDNKSNFKTYETEIEDPSYESYISKKVTGLNPDTSYVFKVKAWNNYGVVESSHVVCNTTKKVLNNHNNQGIVIGATAGVVSACLLILFIGGLVYFFRRKKQGKGQKNNERIRLKNSLTEDNENVGLKDNVLYVSADSDFSAKKEETSVAYAVVTKAGKLPNSKTCEEPYAEFNKEGTKTTKKGKQTNPKINERINTEKEDVYENMAEQNKRGNAIKKVNKDGLVYADLVFNERSRPKDRKFVIRGLENRTTYADIDLNIKAEPLPSDESDQEICENKNKNK